MRVLLQRADGLFFQDMGLWVSESAKGRGFKSGVEAMDLAGRCGMTGIVLVYEFGGKVFDFTIPLSPEDAPSEQKPAINR